MPGGFKGLSTEQETKQVDFLALELQDKFGIMRLDLKVDRAGRTRRPPPGPRKKRILIIGASNSDRLAVALCDNGHKVFKVWTSSWMATPDAVSSMERHVRDTMEEVQPEAVIFMMLTVLCT